MILCDTGVLLCLVDTDQPMHRAYKAKIATIGRPLLTTWACLAESMYLALGKGGWPMQKTLAEYLQDELVFIYDIKSSDYDRLFALMEKYQDRPMDLADATLVLTAEKTNENRILTTDSDFLFYRIADKRSFDIIEA